MSAGFSGATQTQDAKSAAVDGTITWAASATTAYDTYGRVTGTKDPLGRTTATSYRTTATTRRYLPVGVVSTNAKGWNTTTRTTRAGSCR